MVALAIHTIWENIQIINIHLHPANTASEYSVG